MREPNGTPPPGPTKEPSKTDEPRESPWWKVGAAAVAAAIGAVVRWALEHASGHAR